MSHLARRSSLLALSACLAGSIATIASAQSVGIDITHQEIQDTSSYGAVGGVNGYAWGSYTCNIGDTPLLWQSNGTPALAMNAYRLANGRLQQIGLSFAKHACCVGNGAGCGTCSTTGPAGTLRPGCRDIYSSGFNGGQTRLGPRSGINPYASTFTTIPSGSGDLTWRRVRIAQTDMNATTYPGALYFAEGVYVCFGEPPANQLNNATYEVMSVANAGATPTYAWTQTGPSNTGRAAIYAWRDHGLGLNTPDPSVRIVNADVPNEGRFIVAGKATNLGGGSWRYDYAVYNLNSHLSASGVRVPVDSSLNVSDIGFSDVDYHSGEIYDNTNWTGTEGVGNVNWVSPASFATNPNTNALRWGTMYNYWFTVNAAPAANNGTISIDLFRPNTPSSIQATGVPVPAIPACRADFNGVGGVSVQDVFDFLAAWFADDFRADINGQNGVTVQDIFDYLALWFAGCP